MTRPHLALVAAAVALWPSRPAAAAEPAASGLPAGLTLDVHAAGAVANASQPAASLVGVGAAAGWRPVPRLGVEVLVQGGLDGLGAARVDARPEVRAFLTDPRRGNATLSAVLGYGASLTAPAPLGAAGLSLDVYGERVSTVRVQARYLARGTVLEGAQLAVGVAWPRPREAVVQAPPPPPELPPNELIVDIEDALVWVPQPYGGWMTAEEAKVAIRTLPRGLTVRVSAPGFLPTQVQVEGPTEVPPMRAAPAQGALVVMANPGDAVHVGDQAVPVSDDGLAILNAPEGVLDVGISGGGSTLKREAAIAEGYALWVRGRDPDPIRVRFELASMDITPETMAQLEHIVERAGAWSFEVQGFHSPEGGKSLNEQLAQGRAEKVVSEMVRLGLDPSRIKIVPPPPAPPGGFSDDELRAAVVTPFRVEAE